MHHNKRCLLSVTVIVAMYLCLLYTMTNDFTKLDVNTKANIIATLDTPPVNSEAFVVNAADRNCVNVHFSEKKLPVTYLASYPGSGNTWVRHLLQQATGEPVKADMYPASARLLYTICTMLDQR